MLPTPEAQCAANVKAWLSKHGLGGTREFLRVEADRAYLPRDEWLETSLSQMCAQGLIEKRYAGNHGADIVIGYRECVPRCAAQVVVHSGSIEIDFDFWQPWDLVGGIGHLWEILRNKFHKRKTDPFTVAEQLKKRGINA